MALATWGSTMQNTAIGLSDNRLKHMLQVGHTAETLASELFGWPEAKCREMFLLGYMHDVGYEYATEPAEHPEIAGAILRDAGYTYWQEVRWHGIPSPKFESDELLVLNLADNITDGAGNRVSVEERLRDIEARYGSDSPQLRDATLLVEELSATLKARSLSSKLLDATWWGCQA